MKVRVSKLVGLDDSLIALRESKRHITPEEEDNIRYMVDEFTLKNGKIVPLNERSTDSVKFHNLVDTVFKWGIQHPVLLKYMMFSCTVYDLHRGAQDDFDAHAERLDNRIVRASTRLSKFTNEKSEFYRGKILTTDDALKILGMEVPDEFMVDDVKFVKCVNGYVREEYKDDNDVLRGLYMLSIPSSFIFQCDIVEFAHIVKLRDKDSTANPELRQAVEMMMEQLHELNPRLTREFFYSIPN